MTCTPTSTEAQLNVLEVKLVWVSIDYIKTLHLEGPVDESVSERKLQHTTKCASEKYSMNHVGLLRNKGNSVLFQCQQRKLWTVMKT